MSRPSARGAPAERKLNAAQQHVAVPVAWAAASAEIVHHCDDPILPGLLARALGTLIEFEYSATDNPPAQLDLYGAGGGLPAPAVLAPQIIDRLQRAHRIGMRLAFGTDTTTDVPGRTRAAPGPH